MAERRYVITKIIRLGNGLCEVHATAPDLQRIKAHVPFGLTDDENLQRILNHLHDQLPNTDWRR